MEIVEDAEDTAEAEAAQDGTEPVAWIKAAEKWLKAATDNIRNDRLATRGGAGPPCAAGCGPAPRLGTTWRRV